MAHPYSWYAAQKRKKRKEIKRSIRILSVDATPEQMAYIQSVLEQLKIAPPKPIAEEDYVILSNGNIGALPRGTLDAYERITGHPFGTKYMLHGTTLLPRSEPEEK